MLYADVPVQLEFETTSAWLSRLSLRRRQPGAHGFSVASTCPGFLEDGLFVWTCAEIVYATKVGVRKEKKPFSFTYIYEVLVDMADIPANAANEHPFSLSILPA